MCSLLACDLGGVSALIDLRCHDCLIVAVRVLFWAPLLPSLTGKFDEVYEALAHAHPNLTVYKKEEIPERWHYKYNNRIQPIIAVADEGWYILQNKSDGFMCEYVTVVSSHSASVCAKVDSMDNTAVYLLIE